MNGRSTTPTQSRNRQRWSRRHRGAWRSAVVLATLLLSVGLSAAPSAASSVTGTSSHANSVQAVRSSAPLQALPDLRTAVKARRTDDPQPVQYAACQEALSAGPGLLDRLRTTSRPGPEAARQSSAAAMLASALATARAAVDAQPPATAHPGAVAPGRPLQPACAELLSAEAAARSALSGSASLARAPTGPGKLRAPFLGPSLLGPSPVFRRQPRSTGPSTSTAPALATGTQTISGTVTGPGATPLVGISVTACSTTTYACSSAVVTAANGTYTVSGLAADSYNVRFSDPNGTYASGLYSTAGFTPDWNSATAVTLPPNATGINVQLPLGYSISGTVTGPGATPLANINVNACPTTFNGMCGWASTAADGTYTVTGLAAGSYRVNLHDPNGTYAPGFYSTSGFTLDYYAATPVTVPPSATGINVQLPLGYSISGTVTGPGGGPLRGIWVAACSNMYCAGWYGTASDGSYTFTLVPGTYRVQFHDPNGTYASGLYSTAGFTPDWNSATAVTLPPNATGINVQLPLGYSISGTVTGPGATLLAGINVNACPTFNGMCGGATTAANGTYTVTGLAGGSYKVNFNDSSGTYASGLYSTAGFTPDWNSATAVTLPPNATGINVQLPLGYSISGTVTGPGATPLANIQVNACSTTNGAICHYAITAANGSYTASGLVAGSYQVQFNDYYSGTYASGWYSTSGLTPASWLATTISVPPSASGINVALPLGYSISGTVTGPGGIPLGDIRMGACPTTFNGNCRWAWTASNGTYTVRGLVAGSYQVQFWDPNGTYASGYYSTSGFTPDANSATAVTVPPNATGINVQLPLGYSISGTVTGPGATPLANIQVNACSTTNGSICGYGYTASNGTYTVTGLVAGSYQVQFSDYYSGTYASGWYSASGFTPDWKSLTAVGLPPSASGINVQLPLGYSISGTVTGPGGTPLAGISVYACPTTFNGSCGYASTAANGTYTTWPSTAAGSYQVQFDDYSGTYASGWYSTSGFTPDLNAATLVSLPPNASGINVQLPLGYSISGSVTGPGATPLAGIWVNACPTTFNGICGGATTAANGTYIVTGLAAGSYKVQFYDPNGTYASGWYSTSGFTPNSTNATPVSVPPNATGINVQLPLAGATYVSLAPARILDSRNGTGLSGTFSTTVPRSLQVTGVAGVPSNAIAVTGTLTVTDQTSAGYASLTTVSTPVPSTSTLNFPLADNRATGVTAPLGSGGVLWITYVGSAGGATTDLLFDVTGYYVPTSAGATYVSLAPARILDSRNGTGLSGTFSTTVPRSLQVTGVAGVPSNAIAVTGTLTVTNQTSAGYASLTTVSTPVPSTSTLNFPLADNRATGVTAPLGSGGVLWITYVGSAGGATTDLLFDVTGYYVPTSAGATYVSLAPARILDSRNGTGLSGTFSTTVPRSLQVTGVAGVPSNAIAVTGTLTVTNQTSAGYASLTTVSTPVPSTSTLNFPLADNRATGVIAPLGSGGVLWITYVGSAGGATTDLLFDVTGYFQ